MNKYIQSLKDQNKLNLSTDKSISFKWPYTKIAGPCSVEGDSIIEISREIKKCGANAFRAGAYKPCTFPILDDKDGWKEGLKEKGLELLKESKIQSGLPIVTEVMDIRKIEEIGEVADVFQIGTRNFQNYSLLDEFGKLDKPILLKRGTWGTLDEILGACERILDGGNEKIAICLRGVVGAPSYRHIFPSTRWAPDLMMIPALQQFTNIPIIYDPSHATGYRDFVVPVSKGAMSMGADGLIVECHPNPTKSISDADQAIGIEELKQIKEVC